MAEPIERPLPSGANAAAFGSDVVADTLRALDVPYIALNPGASYRGLHDSLVNYLGNSAPQMLLCLHEESAVAIAHGYAKVTGRAMAAALHSNVGLMHATMAIFNAWCDRMPVLLIGATGPVDAAKRRPWIDWIHTARDQGALVRNYTKWDDQPASPAAAREALMRAWFLTHAAPMGPVYVNLDAEMQEAKLAEPLAPLDVARFTPAVASAPAAEHVAKAAALLKAANNIVMLIGRTSRNEAAWAARVKLAEATGARVITCLKVGACFPTDHPLHLGAPSVLTPDTEGLAALAKADLILSLDWVDLAGTLKAAQAPAANAKMISVTADYQIHNGWSMDHQGLAPVDVLLAADPEHAVPPLLGALGATPARPGASVPAKQTEFGPGPLTVEHLARALRGAVGARPCSLTHLPLSWNGAWWPFRHPLDFLGSDGGGGLAAGPGVTVGAALALKGSGRLAVGICGDGDFLMGATALWTATHYRIPLLIVVANNRSFYNDEVHQERVARMRSRPVENKWIGQRISDPDIDLAALARAQGALGFGPIEDVAKLGATFAEAIAAVEQGQVAVVDVRVAPGYTPAMTAAVSNAERKA
ncbi:MAG TPA: thiamine pyrophosphate-binding protein [Xanthobacteraceae bacterium]|nr:thiamine pyrophosphate-binding protein [Xanthobacteraceae bacterium]